MNLSTLITEAKITATDGQMYKSPKEAYTALLQQGKTPEEIDALFPNIKLPAHKYYIRVAKKALGSDLSKFSKIKSAKAAKIKNKKLKLSPGAYEALKSFELDSSSFLPGKSDEAEWGTENGFDRLEFLKAIAAPKKLPDGFSVSLDADAENYLLSTDGAVSNAISILMKTDGDAEVIKQFERIRNGNFSKNFRVFSDETVEKRKSTAIAKAWEAKDYNMSVTDEKFYDAHNKKELKRFKRIEKDGTITTDKFVKFFVMPEDGALAVLTSNQIPKNPQPESGDKRLIGYFNKKVEGSQILSLYKMIKNGSDSRILLDDLLKKKMSKYIKAL